MSQTLKILGSGSRGPAKELNLVPGDSPPKGKADAWDELNHLDEKLLEFSLASDILRAICLWLGVLCAGAAFYMLVTTVTTTLRSAHWWAAAPLVFAIGLALVSVFLLRFDLRLPKDRPVRFNRRQRKVYVNYFSWNHNPFGQWHGGVKILDWDRVHAEVVKQIGASGEVVTQRYALELVEQDPSNAQETGRVRLQHGAQTVKQYEEQWEFVRRYMSEGPKQLPIQHLRDRTPSFVDCLLFCMPWFSPTGKGRATRSRMGTGYWVAAIFLSLMFPLWMVFGFGNFLVMRLAPEASWPDGMDAASRA